MVSYGPIGAPIDLTFASTASGLTIPFSNNSAEIQPSGSAKPVINKARGIFLDPDRHHGAPEVLPAFDKVSADVHCLIGCLFAAYHFNQQHHGNRIEEVKANHLVRPVE